MLLKKGGTQQLVIAVPYLDTHEGVLFNTHPPPLKFLKYTQYGYLDTQEDPARNNA